MKIFHLRILDIGTEKDGWWYATEIDNLILHIILNADFLPFNHLYMASPSSLIIKGHKHITCTERLIFRSRDREGI